MPSPSLQVILQRLEGLDLHWTVSRDGEGHLAVQIQIHEGPVGAPPANDPSRAPPTGGAEEPVSEPEAAGAAAEPERATGVLLPRIVPDVFAELPAAVRALSARLPAVPGRLGPSDRVFRAARLGAADRRVANGDAQLPDPSGRTGLATRVYCILRAHDGSGPWICRLRSHYNDAVGQPFDPESVSRAFGADSEAQIYFWASGLELALPPQWPVRA